MLPIPQFHSIARARLSWTMVFRHFPPPTHRYFSQYWTMQLIGGVNHSRSTVIYCRKSFFFIFKVYTAYRCIMYNLMSTDHRKPSGYVQAVCYVYRIYYTYYDLERAS